MAQEDSGGTTFERFGNAFSAAYDPKGFEAKRLADREFGLRKQQADQQAEQHNAFMARSRLQDADDASKRDNRDTLMRGVRGNDAAPMGGLSAPYSSAQAPAVGTGLGNPAPDLSEPSFAVRGQGAQSAPYSSMQVPTGQGLGRNVPGGDSPSFELPQAAPAARAPKSKVRQALEDRQAYAVSIGDMASFDKGTLEGKNLDWSEAYSGHMKAWMGMTPEDKAAVVQAQSAGDAIQGLGTFEPGPKGKGGFLHYMPKGKRPMTLSDDEAGQIFAMGNMMEVDPERAQGEITKLKGNVRKAAEDMFRLQTAAVGVDNQATQGENTAQYQQRHLGIMAQSEQDRRKQAERADWSVQNYVDDKGNVKPYMYNSRDPKNPQFQEMPVPPGMRMPNARPPVDNKQVMDLVDRLQLKDKDASMAELMDRAKGLLYPDQSGGGGGGFNLTPAQLKALQDSLPGAKKPAAGTGLPGRSNDSSAQAASVQQTEVAEPALPSRPPETRTTGLSITTNPAFTAWEQQYGPAYAKQVAERQAAAAAAKRDYNPYTQNRVQ
jgi:hypothetical protein